MKKCNVALVGVGSFGGHFVDIYKEHPNVGTLGIFDMNLSAMNEIAERFGITKTYQSFDEILHDETVDAVHLVTPIPLHADQTVQVLEAGKHCACTVPMATSLEDIQRIVDAVRKSEKNYMMMETTLYTYQFFYARQMQKNGEFGKIQFMRGSHYQDMSNWPDYWRGLPPFHYGTHALAPMVAMSGSRIKRVHCFGSGIMAPELVANYGNPYPVESALFEFENGMKGEATRSLFETARVYQEGFHVYGSKKSFEWGFSDGARPLITERFPRTDGRRGSDTPWEPIDLPNPYSYLPSELHRFTVGSDFDPTNPQEIIKQGAGAGHHGSHPHLVHEFVMSIIEGRKPWIDEKLGGNITAAGICAHISAMNNGESVIVPTFA